MATAAKSHTPGVVIVDRDTFIKSLGAGLANMASAVIASRAREEDVFPFVFDITVDGKETTGWIQTVVYTDKEYVTAEIQYLLEDDEIETTVTVSVDLNFHGDPLAVREFETTWFEDDVELEA